MPDTVQHVQARHVRRCQITLGAGANLRVALVAAFNAQSPGRGDAIKPWIIGARILTSTAGFTLGDSLALVSMVPVAAGYSYDAPAVNMDAETWIGGSGTATVEVFYSGEAVS